LKYKCIIFDCDGVLVDSEAISNKVIVELANTHGANIDIEYALKNYAGTSLKFVTNDIESIIGKKLPNNFNAEYRRISFIRFQQEIQPVKGVVELIQSLEVPFCVASNGPLNKMDLNLKLTGLSQYFQGNMFSAYELNSWKPDPTLFLHAAKTMGFEPKDCAVVEDSLSGIKAAVTGGFDVYALTHAHKTDAFIEHGATVFSAMNELKKLLENS